MDWDPTHSSLFSGEGTPWGKKQYGQPDKPVYAQDPMAFKGFDSTELRKQMEQGIRLNRANSLQGTQGQLAKMNPYGGSAEGNRAIGASMQGTNQDLAMMNANLGRQDWDDRVGAMDRYNNQLWQQYQQDAKANEDEDKNRGGFLGGLMELGGTIGGAALGGPAGAAIGKKLTSGKKGG